MGLPLLRHTALRILGVRRLVNDRDIAVAALGNSEVELAAARAELAATQAELASARVELRKRTRFALDTFLAAARPGSFFSVAFNGAALDLPVETLRTIVHCTHLIPDQTLEIWVETAHLNWMLERLAPGGTFLDIGASTGATTLPTVKHFANGEVTMVAFEPASAARGLLEATLERNSIACVDVRPFAVSDVAGEATFREYLPDETGNTPWLPEASSLVATRMASQPSRDIAVPVVTLDDQMEHANGFSAPVVVKIDVEGFEAFVLRGASKLIACHRPSFAIDIHVDPFGDGVATTES